MKAADVFVVEAGIGAEEQYKIGILRRSPDPTPDAPLVLDIVEADRNRVSAFDKARALAAGRDVFFSQFGRPGFLQDHYNAMACPKCGLFSSGMEVLTFESGTQSLRCHACKQAIVIHISEP